MKLNSEVIEEIKNKNDIADVMSKYVTLHKKGKNFTCLCPFHNDTNPSMVVSQDKQIYKCFSCGAGGDVLNFVKEYEKISFGEAVKKLGEYVGISVEVDNRKSNKIANKLADYLHLNEEANNLFAYMLYEYDQQTGYQYLKERNFSDDIIKTFQLGYSYQDDMVLKLLQAKKLDLNKAVEIGLLQVNQNNVYHDTYVRRITYPIIDESQNVIGFSCRTIDKSEPKYLNSLESKLFDKSSTLYNLNNALESIKKEKTVYILEGPNDVIAMYKAGIKNAVCVMGTALTNRHIAKLKRYGVSKVVLAFDGDEAGNVATIKAIKLLVAARMTTKVISFDLDDPDDFLNKHGYDKFHAHVKREIAAIQYQIDYEFKNINTDNYEEKKKLVQVLASNIGNLDAFDQEYYFNYLAGKSDVSVELIQGFAKQANHITQPINKSSNSQQRRSLPRKTSKVKSDVENAMINILYFIMNDKRYYNKFDQEIGGSFYDKHYRQLYNVISAFYLQNELFDIEAVDIKVSDKTIMKELMEILSAHDYDKYNDEKVFLDSIDTLKLEQYYLKIKDIEMKLSQLLDPLQKAKLSTEILETNKAIRQIKNSKFNR